MGPPYRRPRGPRPGPARASTGAVEQRTTRAVPEGVGELSDGDPIVAEVENAGEMTVDLTERDRRFADVDVQKGGQGEGSSLSRGVTKAESGGDRRGG